MSGKSSFYYFFNIIKRCRDLALGIYRAKYFRPALILYFIIMIPLTYVSVLLGRQGAFIEAEAEDEIIMVKAARVDNRDFSDTLSVIGTVKGASEVDLKFEISGRVRSFNFREGDAVRRGEVIVSLDAEDVVTRREHAQAKLNSVTSQYLSAQEQYDVHKELYEMGAIIRARLREVELNVKALESEVQRERAELRLAESELLKTVIAAPTDGVMGARHVETGDFVSPHDEVGTFIEVENVFVEAGIIEREIQRVRRGQQVTITFDTYPDRVFSGFVDNVSRMVRGETRTLPIQIRIENPELKLFSGMLADCEIMIEHIGDVIMVPSESIIDLGQMTVVPLINSQGDDTGVVELRQVETGYSRADLTEISYGLDPGDLIVQETQRPLSDGMTVRVIEVSEVSAD